MIEFATPPTPHGRSKMTTTDGLRRTNAAAHAVGERLPARGVLVACIGLIGAGALPGLAAAQQATGPNAITASASVSALGTFKTNLDNDGGNFHWTGAIVNGSLSNRVNAQWTVGFNLGYQYEKWTFSSPSAFGPQAPWSTVNRPSVGFNVAYQWAPDLSLFVSPQFEWAYEKETASNGQNFGAVVGATKFFSRDHILGVGAAVFHQIDATRVFPFLIVNWKLDDRWRVANPFRAGPAGGAGLELIYSLDDNWELAGGGTYRQYRFRLQENGPNANGIGQNQGIPVFLRVARKLGPTAQIELYGGATFAGTVKLRDPNGNTLVSSDYNAAPFLALSLSGTF